jgi:hypothetical protein
LVLPETIRDLASLINTYVRERAIKEGLSYFKVKTLSSSLENSITEIFQNIPLHKTNKLFYIFFALEMDAVYRFVIGLLSAPKPVQKVEFLAE